MEEEKFTSREGTVDYGKDYEYLMAAYCALSLSFDDDVEDFKLSTNNKEMGDFDDVVLEVQLKHGEEHVFALQLKHVSRVTALITLTAKKGNFSLKKYAQEFKKIKTDYVKSCSFSAPFKNVHFILYSNSILEKFEEVDESGMRLNKVDEKDVEITIQRFNNCVGKKFLNLCDNDKNFIYKFKTDKEDSLEEAFFQQFSFYTKQKHALEMQSLIGEVIMKKFHNSCSDVVSSYLNYFNYWCRRDYGNYKLTKRDIKLKLSELLLTPYIPVPNLKNVTRCSLEDYKLMLMIVILFNKILLDNVTQPLMDRLWGLVLYQFMTTNVTFTEWTTPLSSIYTDTFKKMVEIPISAQNESFNELSLKKSYILFWHLGIVPLIIKTEKKVDEQNITHALELCKNEQNRRFILIDKSTYENAVSQGFRNCSDLINIPGLFQEVGKELSLSLQGRPHVPLTQFLANNDQFRKHTSFKEIMLMLDGKLLIGEDCKIHCKHYVSRMIPKILLNIKVIDEISNDNDIYVVSYQDNIEDIHKRFKCCTVELSKYLLTKQIQFTRNYIPKQFSLANVKNLQTIKLFNKFVIVVKGECSKEQFAEIGLKNQSSNYHYVRIVDDERIEWIQTIGSIENLRQYRQDIKDYDREDFVKDVHILNYFKNKINVICADAGMGKSVLLNNALKYYCPSTHWVIIINLNDHTEFFKETHDCVDEVTQYLLEMENRNCDRNHFAEELIKIFFSTKKLVFLWDGFDELPTECLNSVITAIQNLASEDYSQWITARTSSKRVLEDSFNILAVTLPKFTLQNQYDFVYMHLKEKYEDEEVVQKIIQRINENIMTSFNCDYLDYSRNPLHIHMLVQIFLNNSQKEMIQQPIISITDMYEKFIQGKFDCMFEKAEADSANCYMQQIQEQFKISQLTLYEAAALKASFDDETFATLNVNCDELLGELLESEDTLGLIVRVNDCGKPVFAHKTYQEYLTASWLTKNHKNNPSLLTMLFQDKYKNIRLMFDMILAKNSPVHLAVLYRRIDLLEKHKDKIVTSKDNGGRNALHVACAWGNAHPTIETMKNDGKSTKNKMSNEQIRQTYLDSIEFLAKHQKSLLRHMEILTSPSRLEMAHRHQFLNNLYKQKNDDTFKSNIEQSNKILISIETLPKVDNNNAVYVDIVKCLLTYNCNPLEYDELLRWNCFQYADQSLSLAAINLMLDCHKIDLQALKNYNHKPTVLHYAVLLLYDNLIENFDDVPYIEYKYEFGCVNLLQFAANRNNTRAISKLLKTKIYKKVINMQSAFGGNLLASVSFYGNIEAVDVLLQNGAKVTGQQLPPIYAAAFGGQKDCCQRLIEAGGDVNETASDGSSPLFIAVVCSQLEIAKLLLIHDSDVNYVNNDVSALDSAIFNHELELVQLILKYKPNINRHCEKLGYTALHNASIKDNLEIVKCLLQHGADTKSKTHDLLTPLHVALAGKCKEIALELIRADPSVVDEYTETNETPIILAARQDYSDIIQNLIECGADVNSSKSSVSPLHFASNHGCDSSVTTLINAGALVNQADSKGQTPLFYSVDNLTTLKILLNNFADVNFSNKAGVTALHRAAFSGKLDSAEELLKKGADIDAKDNENKTPLHYSIQEKSIEMMNYLLDKGASIEDGGALLCQAAMSGLPESVLLLLHRGVEVNALDRTKNTALHYAVLNGNCCVKTLLDNRANPNIAANFGPFFTYPPLLIALVRNKIEITKQLIDAGADTLNIWESASALHVAASLGDIVSTLLLIDSGLDVNITDKDGRNSLHYAAESKSSLSFFSTFLRINAEDEDLDVCVNINAEDCAKELVMQGINVNHKDHKGQTPLHFACNGKNSGLIKLLIKHNADVNSVNVNNQTPLHILCARQGLVDNAELLTKNDSRLDIIDKFEKTPDVYAMEKIQQARLQDSSCTLQKLPVENGFSLLHKASFEGNTEMAAYLIDSGADVELKTNQGCTPLFYACHGNYKEIVNMLLKKSCTVNVQNNDGNIPLHFAASKAHHEIIKLLCEADSQINTQNFEKITPLHYAALSGKFQSCKVLIEAGAAVNFAKIEADNTAFHWAIDTKSLSLVKLFVENGGRIDKNSLYHAVLTNDLNIVKYLLENAIENMLDCKGLLHLVDLIQNGADPNSIIDNITVLQRTCSADTYDCIKCLLENGAMINNTGDKGKTLMMSKAWNKNLEIAHLLIEQGENVNRKDDNGWTAIFYACSLGNLDLVKLLHEHGADLCVQDNKGSCPLIEAAQYTPLIKYLMNNGANVNHQNNQDVTPLFRACTLDNWEGVRILLEHKANINFTSGMEKLTPLQGAVIHGSSKTVEVLLSFQPDFTILSSSKQSALTNAVIYRKPEIVKLFAKYFLDSPKFDNEVVKDFLEKEWQRCFLYAANLNCVEILVFLQENKLGNIFYKEPHSLFTPLHVACYKGSYETAVYLIENGADIDAKTVDGDVPMGCSAQSGHIKLVELLVKYNAVVDVSNDHGNTSLFLAASCGYLNIVQILHENGAQIHVVDVDGDTPLHDAAANGHLAVVQYLVSKKAKIEHRNNNNKTPLDLAIDNAKEDVVQFLSK